MIERLTEMAETLRREGPQTDRVGMAAELESMRATLEALPPSERGDSLEYLDRLEAQLLAEAIDPPPSPADLLPELEQALTNNRPPAELFEIRNRIRLAGEPDSPEFEQATTMIRGHLHPSIEH